MSEADSEPVQLRRPVSNIHPLFQFYVGDTTAQSVTGVWAAIPEDIRPYSAVHLHHRATYAEGAGTWLRAQLEAAQAAGIPVIVQNNNFFHCRSAETLMPMADLGALFAQFPVLIGTAAAEQSCDALTDVQKRYTIETIETTARHGGLFIWMDMGYLAKHVFLKAGEDPELYDAIASHGGNVVLVHKYNGTMKYHQTQALAMGFWAGGITGNWGVNVEDFIWWENGMEGLYAPQVKWRSNDVLQSAMTCPEALYGVAVLNAVVGGATVYSFEYCERVMRRGRPTPLLQKTLHPLLRKLAHESLVPDRETVRSRLRVAYHATDPDAPELTGPGEELFRGLYGNPLSDERIRTVKYASRWLPTTGRYYYLPILPKLAPESVLALFPNVITSESYARLFPDKEAKAAYFDRIYPHDMEATAWQVHLGGRWYVANPNENADRNVEVRIDGLTATLTPHTYAIIEEAGNSLRIETDNLRVDNHLWDGGWEGAGPAFERYCDSPDYGDRRDNVFVMHEVGDRKPDLEIASTDEGFSYRERWDHERREYAVTVRHCGWVTMVMRKG